MREPGLRSTPQMSRELALVALLILSAYFEAMGNPRRDLTICSLAAGAHEHESCCNPKIKSYVQEIKAVLVSEQYRHHTLISRVLCVYSTLH